MQDASVTSADQRGHAVRDQPVGLGATQYSARGQLGNCPAGLDVLDQVDTVIIEQQTAVADQKSEYKIKTGYGEQAYSITLQRKSISICDLQNVERVRLFKTGGIRCLFSGPYMEVHSPPGTYIGRVVRNRSTSFTIRNAFGKDIMIIVGPSSFKRKEKVQFKVQSLHNNEKCATITKQQSERPEACFMIQFPTTLAIKEKVLLVAACLRISSLYFEYHIVASSSGGGFSDGSFGGDFGSGWNGGGDFGTDSGGGDFGGDCGGGGGDCGGGGGCD